MRFLRLLLVAIFGIFAVAAGLITAAAVSAAGSLVVLVRRMLKQSKDSWLPSRRGAQRFSRPRSGEIIDITATEVPADSHPR